MANDNEPQAMRYLRIPADIGKDTFAQFFVVGVVPYLADSKADPRTIHELSKALSTAKAGAAVALYPEHWLALATNMPPVMMGDRPGLSPESYLKLLPFYMAVREAPTEKPEDWPKNDPPDDP